MRKYMNLAPKYYGPYSIIQQIGNVAYKLLLPSTNKIHPLLHASLLKKKIGRLHSATIQPPTINNEGQIQVFPVAGLDRRIVPHNNIVATQVLVHWVNSTPKQATWEDLTSLRSRFSTFDPSGQGSIEGGGGGEGGMSCPMELVQK
ncbi:hypothetical protein BUALT_Bualt04G0030900 [Buddleja alternifolia]|uniref:Tf2-1-like SH3-like domain-containing protein n=1 Tax=Buddleja alternifolia TaxID=168488 RepID=A0AAV6XKV9_9LAMI|nr:hypothetical protein BUALT_Bualt04G0030900 [Buddleja alternifolia]